MGGDAIRRAGFRTGAVLILVAALRPGALTGQEPPVVDSIVIVTRNVFDDDLARTNFLFRVANALHVTTQRWVIRDELLFRPGDPLDSARLAETLRNLRNRSLFRGVWIDTVRLGGRLIARVETADGWSTSIIANARSTGGEFSWALGGEERNFIGTGARVGLVYRDEPDRTSLTVVAAQDRIRGTRLGVRGVYDDLSDGTVGTWRVGLPFRSLSDRFAVEADGRRADQRVLQFRNGTLSATYRRRLFLQQLTLAYAPRAETDGYLRVALRGQIKREEYLREADTALVIPDTLTAAVGAVAELMRARFKVVTHYNGFAREEDIDLSTRFTVGVLAAPRVLGYPDNGIGPFVGVQTGFDAGRAFGRIAVQAGARFAGGGLDSGTVVAGMTLSLQAIPRAATVLHLEAGAREGAPPGGEFDLGHGIGPRGFPPHAFTGDRMVFGILEHRAFLVDEFLGVVGIGLAAFLDYGGAWYYGQPVRAGGDVGIGLRLGATRATGTNVGRLDLAYRFGEGFSGRRWVLSFGRAYPF